MQKKSTKKWKILLFLPLILIFISIIFGTFSRVSSQNNKCNTPSINISSSQAQSCLDNKASGSATFLNIISVSSGLLAGIFLLFGTPFWIVQIVRANNYNKSLNTPSEQQQIPQPVPAQPFQNNPPSNEQNPPRY